MADPQAREAVRSLLYVLFPLVMLLVLRGIMRQQRMGRRVATDRPARSAAESDLGLASETLQETMAREQAKVDRELREILGRETGLSGQSGAGKPPRQEAREGQAARDTVPRTQQEMTRDDLLDLLLRRKR